MLACLLFILYHLYCRCSRGAAGEQIIFDIYPHFAKNSPPISVGSLIFLTNYCACVGGVGQGHIDSFAIHNDGLLEIGVFEQDLIVGRCLILGVVGLVGEKDQGLGGEESVCGGNSAKAAVVVYLKNIALEIVIIDLLDNLIIGGIRICGNAYHLIANGYFKEQTAGVVILGIAFEYVALVGAQNLDPHIGKAYFVTGMGLEQLGICKSGLHLAADLIVRAAELLCGNTGLILAGKVEHNAFDGDR